MEAAIQLLVVRQGQVVDCIIMHPRRARVPLCCGVTTKTHTMIDDSTRGTDILVGQY
jgi:hypothetical protein